MAPRRKSKGKKPPETMRQRQMRLRKMELQLKGSKKRLPPGKKGGAIVKSKPSKPMSPRLKAALDKKARAAKGTTGGTRAAGGRGLAKQTPRLPAGKSRFQRSAYGQDIQALKNLVRQGGKKGVAAAKQLVKLGVRYAPAAKLLATAAAKAAPGAAIAAGVARSTGRKGAAKMSKLGGDAPVKDKTSRATSRKVGPKAVKGGYTISKKASETAKKVATKPSKTSKPAKPAKASKPSPQPAKRDRMEKASSEERMAKWAMSNRKMIEKSGTKKQREILAKALKKNK